MAEEKKLPRGFRLTEETFNKFKNITEELGGDQQQAMAKLIEIYELEAGKESLPEMRESIETFEGYVFSAIGMFRHVLETCQNMKTIVRAEYDAMLRSKDTIISELQEKLETAKSIVAKTEAMEQKYQAALNEKDIEKEELDRQLEKAKKEKEMSDAEWGSKYNSLEKICAGLRSSETEAKEMVSSFMKENNSLKEEIQAKKEEHQKEKAEINLKLREKEAIAEELEGKLILCQRDAMEQKQQYEIFKATAGTELQLAVQKKENEVRAEYKEEMDELRKELEKYREMYYNK